MTKYETIVCGYIGFTIGDGWVDFHAIDGTIDRWDAATEKVTRR